MEYYSQIQQDKYYIENVLKFKKGGFFLDVGANNGIFENNTYALEKYLNFTGICIEANNKLIQDLKKNRPSSVVIEAAVWNNNCFLEFEECDIDVLGRIANLDINQNYFKANFEKTRKISKIQAYTLNDILKNCNIPNNTIDYMSLDIEGAELQALQGMDFNAYDVKFMTIEHGNRPKQIDALSSYLKTYNYSVHRRNKQDVEFTRYTLLGI